MKTFKRIFGFTLIELMIALAVAATLYNVMATYYFQSAQAEKDRTNANLHKTIAQAYANYITDNYGGIIAAMSGNLAVLKYSDLPPKYKTGITLTGFAPCALILKDSSGKVLFPLIVDVTNTGYTPTSNAAAGASYLGDYAAYLDGSGIYQSNSGWSIPNTSPYFAALATCDYPNLVQKSLAINLVMAPFFMQPTNDLGLNRVKDISVIGPNNKNVEKTDIVLGYPTNPTVANRYNRIIFNNKSIITNPPYCASGLSESALSIYNNVSNIICRNSTLKAMAFKSVVANANITVGSLCTQNDLGNIYVDSGALPNNDPKSSLVCSYSPIMCTLISGTSRQYCYLSTSTKTQTFTTSLTSPFVCANRDATTPVAVAAKSNVALINISQNVCITNASPSQRCGTGNSGNTARNLIILYSGLTPSQNILTTSSVTTNSITNTVYTGATAPIPNTIAGMTTTPVQPPNVGVCTNICSTLYGGLNATYNTSNTVDCYCNQGTRGVEIRAVSLVSGQGNTNLNSVTCTNKTVYQ